VRILMATLFLLPTLSLSSEEEQDPMPASAKRTVAQHDREVQRLKERYLSDLAEIREDTLRDLERDMEKTTRRGDLEGALAIKEKITALEEQEEEIAEAPTDFLGNAKKPFFAGRTFNHVRGGGYHIAFSEDGTLTTTNWGHRYNVGEWTFEDGTIHMVFENGGNPHEAEVDPENQRLTFMNGDVYVISEDK